MKKTGEKIFEKFFLKTKMKRIMTCASELIARS